MNQYRIKKNSDDLFYVQKRKFFVLWGFPDVEDILSYSWFGRKFYRLFPTKTHAKNAIKQAGNLLLKK